MSVHKRNGKWQVKWREGDSQRSRTFDRKGDADRFDLEVRRRLQLGALASDDLIRTAPTLDAFVLGGFETHAAHAGARHRQAVPLGAAQPPDRACRHAAGADHRREAAPASARPARRRPQPEHRQDRHHDAVAASCRSRSSTA